MHVVKGYPERLPFPKISPRQSSHTALSAGMEAPRPLFPDGDMENPFFPA